MATYYVNSGAGGANTGGSWTDAYTAFGSAVTAAVAGGDIILVHYTHQENLGADTVYTFANNVRVFSVDKDNSDALTVMGTGGWIGSSSTNRSITIGGAYKIFVYGITLRTAGTTTDNIILSNTDGQHIEYESCYFWEGNTSTSGTISFGTATDSNTFVKAKNCTFRFGSTGQHIGTRPNTIIEGCSVSSAGSIPTTLFKGNLTATGYSATRVKVNGCDFSNVNTTIVGDQTDFAREWEFVNCKMASSFTWMAAQTVGNKGSAIVYVYNCSGGDTHYDFGYYDAFGEVTVSTGIYATDAAANNKYDGTNRCSWKVVTTANCSYYTPFVTPWFEIYHDGTAAITPSIEVLGDRTGSPLKNNEIWGEWSYQGTSGSTQASFVNDRKALLAVAADQATSSLGASDWTGETAGSPSAWFGTLAPESAITPAEIGMLRARVCVGKASTTVYVDPSVRYS